MRISSLNFINKKKLILYIALATLFIFCLLSNSNCITVWRWRGTDYIKGNPSINNVPFITVPVGIVQLLILGIGKGKLKVITFVLSIFNAVFTTMLPIVLSASYDYVLAPIGGGDGYCTLSILGAINCILAWLIVLLQLALIICLKKKKRGNQQ